MANINDYLKWRGDIKISKESPFNEIDSMILARFSYLLFDRIPMKRVETIESISLKMKDFPNKDFLYNGDKELITNLGVSLRFKNLKVTDYKARSDVSTEEQFGAITIHLSSKELYISFLGTDKTINGWKEDFNMGFMENVPCQITGRNYTRKIATKYPHKKIRLGGHSKGGNVAIYAGLTSSRRIQRRIIKIYNYDGPGFGDNVFKTYGKKAIMSKIETYVPQDSIVGRVLEHYEKVTVVLSLEKGLFEHDIFSWQVFKDYLITVDKNTELSENIDKTITEWFYSTTVDQRKILVDIIFELFYATKATTFEEIVQDLKGNVPKILKKYGEIPKQDKKVITEMIGKLIGTNINILKKESLMKLNNIKNEYITKSHFKVQELDKKYLNKLRSSSR